MNTISSMTGAASVQYNSNELSFSITIKTVNNRFLDAYFKLSDNISHLESNFRALCAEYLKRGKIECTVSTLINSSELSQIDESELEKLAKSINTIKKHIDFAQVNALEILNTPGILKNGSGLNEEIEKKLNDGFKSALEKLIESRKREGEKLKISLLSLLDNVESCVKKIKPMLDKIVSGQRQKLLDKIASFDIEVDENRIEQEVVLAAQKADVQEEYDRLCAHIVEVRNILQKGGLVGKRLDIMMQELNRESNTLASKASSIELTKIAVDLKVLIEQMREQIQNLE